MVGALMLERFHLFSMACALVLASACLGSLLGSLQRTKDGSAPVHQMVLRELPIVVYIWSLSAFLCPPENKPYLYASLIVYLATGAVALYRFFSYGRKHEFFQRRTMLNDLQRATQEIERIQLKVMSDMERAKYLRVQQDPQPPQRRSRYRRDPVI